MGIQANWGRPSDPPRRVVVGDADPDASRLVQRVTEQAGFQCAVAESAEDAVALAVELRPDLIVLGLDSASAAGADVLRRLRSTPVTRATPVIVVTATPPPSATHLLALADDYILKPFGAEELVARLHVVLRRARVTEDVNPVTGLAGNASVLAEVGRRLDARRTFAYLYIDIDDFRVYNDAYGIPAGDAVLVMTADVIDKAVAGCGPADRFIGHIGADDFVVLVDPDAAEPIARAIVRSFDDHIPALYRRSDIDRGGVALADRQGAVHVYPVVSLSIGVVRTDRHDFRSPVAIADMAHEMKAVAQRRPGSQWAIDRRRGVGASV